MRGHNPILMEDLKNNSGWIAARAAMAHTRSYSSRTNFATLTPQNELSTTNYCLANLGKEYLVYQPGSGEFSVNLAAGNYATEWFNSTKGVIAAKGSIHSSGGKQSFSPPFAGPYVFYVKSYEISTAPGKRIYSENFENGAGKFEGKTTVEGALVVEPKGSGIFHVYSATVSDSTMIRFRIKPLTSITGAEVLVWSDSLKDNTRYPLPEMKTNEWTTVKIRADEMGTGGVEFGHSLDGH